MTAEDRKYTEISAVLNLVPYLDTYFMEESGREITLKYIAEHYRDDPVLSESEAFQLLLDAAEDPKIGEIVLMDQSQSHENLKADLTQGCTFRDTEGNYYVAFRGTGDGRWPDNGDGMTKISTEMQEASRAYFDETAESCLLEAKENGAKIFVTGHSKGGNEAQYVYLTSENEALIDRCYSFDGQGFSQISCESFRTQYGENYEEKLHGMYSVCGENDFVHDLGEVIIPEENTYFVETSGSGFANLHMLENMIGDGSGNYRGLPLQTEGESIQHGTQGPVGAFAKKLSANMMQLDDENLHGTAVAIMALIDPNVRSFRSYVDPEDNGEIVGNVSVDGTDFLDLLANGAPAVLETLFFTEEGHALCGHLISSGFRKLYDSYGVPGVLAGAGAGILLLTHCSTTLLPLIAMTGYGVLTWAKGTDMILDHAARMSASSEAAAVYLSRCRADARWFFQGNGAKEADRSAFLQTDGSAERNGFSAQIRLDTSALQNLAARIRAVNSRLSLLSSRLNRLAQESGPAGAFLLLPANIRIGPEDSLERAAACLQETAEDFLQAERLIRGKQQVSGGGI